MNTNPRGFLRGLVHSDGCRVTNKVTVNGNGYEYPRYIFTNTSGDILDLFGWACDLLGVPWRKNRLTCISVARRDGVAVLDGFIGPKT